MLYESINYHLQQSTLRVNIQSKQWHIQLLLRTALFAFIDQQYFSCQLCVWITVSLHVHYHASMPYWCIGEQQKHRQMLWPLQTLTTLDDHCRYKLVCSQESVHYLLKVYCKWGQWCSFYQLSMMMIIMMLLIMMMIMIFFSLLQFY